MTLTLDLTPEEHDALTRRASALGTTPEAVLRGLIAGLPRTPAAPDGLEPDDPEDPEERAERDRERAEIAANVLRWRAERGA